MSKYAKVIALAAGMLSASSCLVRCGDYTYLALGPVSGMTVLETRVPVSSGLRDVQPFAVSAAIAREGFRLIVRTHENDDNGDVTLSVEAAVPMSVAVTRVPTAAYFGTDCIHQIKVRDGIRLSWTRRRNCKASSTITVVVSDAKGLTIASEELPVTLVTNGRRCDWDSP